jgi:3-oxoacyl-[acyl-carrier-protein] synthase-3
VLVARNGTPVRARLAGVEGYVPERVLTNAELERIVDTTDEWIVSRTGIRERHVAADDQATSDLAVEAARRLLERTGTDAADLDAVLVATTTPDHVFPPTAPLVAGRIGARSAAAVDLNAACSGFIYGLAQSTALVECGMARNVLLIGSEVLTRYVDWTDRTTCVLFGDGAGAALVSAAPPDAVDGFLGFDLGADGDLADQLTVPAGGTRAPAHTAAPEDLCIRMNGREVYKFATRIIEESARRLLERLEIGVDEIDLMVAHQANIRILEYATERLGIPEDRVFNNIDRVGNTSSASIPIALAEARDRGRLRPGDLVLMVGFGAGLTWGAAVARYEPPAAPTPDAAGPA